MDSCCKEWAEEVKRRQVDYYPAWGWAVDGCCGGGCVVLTGLKFCPFCGTKLPETDQVDGPSSLVEDNNSVAFANAGMGLSVSTSGTGTVQNPGRKP